jgi:group I intron endonuclease
MKYEKLLISGAYNIFTEGWNGCGIYVCSGLYESSKFKSPIYIGSSSDIRNRIQSEHINELNKNKHENHVFQASWNKHSQKEGFVWWLLEICPEDQTLNYEQKYLDLYRPFVDEFGGFNIAHNAQGFKGGHKPWNKGLVNMYSQKTKQKMSESRKGKYYGINNPNYGKITPEETKQKISLSKMGKSATWSAKKVRCIENGIVYNSIVEAAKVFNISEQHIGSVCRKKRKTCGGFHWEYVK